MTKFLHTKDLQGSSVTINIEQICYVYSWKDDNGLLGTNVIFNNGQSVILSYEYGEFWEMMDEKLSRVKG